MKSLQAKEEQTGKSHKVSKKTDSDKNNLPPNNNTWGGAWTDKKLIAFTKYVRSYLTIMKSRRWQKIYFDGFAGSGNNGKQRINPLFNDLEIEKEEEEVYKGSAQRVLEINDLTFDFYYFIDKNTDAITSLENKLVQKFKDRRLVFRSDDVNNELKKLADALNKNKNLAALVFLDPFGMQINWNSIKALRGTRTDVWILIPTGIIINRLLKRDGKIKHFRLLEKFFGLTSQELKSFFYVRREEPTLFTGNAEVIDKVAKPIHMIAELYIQQLREIWTYVADRPLVLLNKKHCPIYHFVFASNNKIGSKIASQIIKTS